MKLVLLLSLIMNDPALQNLPPAIIHTQSPTSGMIETSWDCRGREVKFSVRTSLDGVYIENYRGVDGRASFIEINQINDLISPISSIDRLNFQCNQEADRLIIGGPKKEGGGERFIVATWFREVLDISVYNTD